MSHFLISNSVELKPEEHKTGLVGAAYNVLVGQSSDSRKIVFFYDDKLDYMGWCHLMDPVEDVGRQADNSQLSADLRRILVVHDHSRREIARHVTNPLPIFKGIVTDKKGQHVITHHFLPETDMDSMKAYLREWVADHGGRAYRDWQIVQVIPGASSFAEEQ